MTTLANPIAIGGIHVANRAFLAPLAGVSDVPFRRLCRDFGADLCHVEMLAAKAVVHGNKRTTMMMRRGAGESLLGAQVTGATPAEIAAAVVVLDEHGFDLVDINMGCPVRKVVNKGWGCALLTDLERLAETVARARAATGKPLSVKIRIAFSRNAMNVAATAGIIARGGVDMLTIHGRTRYETYATPVDHESIRTGLAAARAAGSSDLVTVGNGDIFTAEDAEKMRRASGGDAVMVSRGALGNPWIFRDILEGHADTRLQEWREVVLRHLAYHEECYGNDYRAAALARKHLQWYAHGFPGSKKLREQVQLVDDLDIARRLIDNYAAGLPGDLRRYKDVEAKTPATFDPKYAMDRQLDRPAAEALP